MNWYVRQNILHKEALNLKDFAKGFVPTFAGILLFLGISRSMLENKTAPEIKQTIQIKAEEKGIDYNKIAPIVEQNIKQIEQPDYDRPGTIIEQPTATPETPQKPRGASVSPPSKEQVSLPLISDSLIKREGLRTKVYDDEAGYATIGIGHMMGKIVSKDKNGIPTKIIPNERSKKVFQELFGNSVNFNAVATGRQTLSTNQVKQLAEKVDIPQHYKMAENLFPNINEYPDYVKYALLNGVFRGEFKKDYQVTKAINEGNFGKASHLYLQRKDYNLAKTTGRLRGIIPRMDENKYALLKYALQLGQITQRQYQQKLKALNLKDLTFMR